MTVMTVLTCTGPDCQREPEHRALCHAHYEQNRKQPERPLRVLRSFDPSTRFQVKVLPPNESGCVLWVGATDGDGRYGSFYADGKIQRAHRVAYEWAYGAVPAGLVLDHLCRVTLCVNPDHLEPVTQRENIMRGEAIQAKNAAKTHCLRGHEFTSENTRRMTSGGRACIACSRNRRARLVAQQLGAVPTPAESWGRASKKKAS